MKKIITKFKNVFGKKERIDYLPPDLALVIAQHPNTKSFLTERYLAKNGKINHSDVVAALRNFIQYYGVHRVDRLADYFAADKASLLAWVSVFREYNAKGMKIDQAYFDKRNKTTLRYITITALDHASFHHGSKMIPLHSHALAETLLM